MTIQAASYEDIGHALRNARERQGLELAYIAQQLHIRAKYLFALEEGYLDELPGVAYVRGYLQNYGEYLGFDKTDLLQAYEKVTTAKQEPEFYLPEPTRKETTPTPLMIGGGIGIIVVCIILWSIFMHEEPMSVEQVSEVPETFSHIVSERFRLTNTLYACYEAEGKLAWPFCEPSHAMPETFYFTRPVRSLVEQEG